MIVGHRAVKPMSRFRADVCVVGAGAAGITLAIELGRAGVRTLLIPGGGRGYSTRYQRLYRGDSVDRIPLERSRQRRFGGTTAVWGGRCIPFDPIDFEARAFVDHSGWPLSASDLTEYYERSHEHLDLGSPRPFAVGPLLPHAPAHLIEGFDDDVLITDQVEKFSLPTNLGKKYYREIAESSAITTFMDSHLIEILYSEIPGSVIAVSCLTKGGVPFSCEAESYVLAMGAFEVTRHLLQPNADAPDGVGNRSGMLGRFFMTHLSGVIAEICIKPELEVINRYEVTDDGVYCRRRLQLSEAVQRERGILNFSSFLHHPPLEDPQHRNPLLSTIFLAKGLRAVALRIPAEYSARLAYGRFGVRDYVAHLRNILLGLPKLISLGPPLANKRLLRQRKLPSLIITPKGNRYSIHYHVEHAPHQESRITLAEEADEHGVRRLHIAMHYDEIDIRSIVTAHEIMKERLEASGVGTLEFLSDDPDSHVRDQIAFGGHHIGTTRMALREEEGVVDTDCKVFGMDNLYVASPSVFPTSGQANPVLTIVALTVRLGDYLRRLHSSRG